MSVDFRDHVLANDSQFFILLRSCGELDGRHTVFGVVEYGLEVVEVIGGVPTGPGEVSREQVLIERVSVEEISV